ncbi:MAG: RidA family protein [Anaerolineae bacterium]|nr:RidA family protein [Anaerolineae bacterium]
MTIKRINPDTLHKNPAFTQVAVVNKSAKLVYVGGQNAVNVKGEVVGDDIATQSAQAYKNVIMALEAAGATMADVFKMTIYMVQGQSFGDGYAAIMPLIDPKSPPPTVAGIMVAGLANPKYLIEIEAVAAID